jgi:hypothetical protein
MTRSELEALIESCKALKVPDIRMDLVIDELVGKTVPLPAYTGSIDAALKAIPSGWTVRAIEFSKRNDWAYVAISDVTGQRDSIGRSTKTAPLAILWCALEAYLREMSSRSEG